MALSPKEQGVLHPVSAWMNMTIGRLHLFQPPRADQQSVNKVVGVAGLRL
jgi:hypothetical protein